MQSDNKFIYRNHLEQYVGTEQEIVIPEGVAVINHCAFQNNKSNITAVTFPATIEEIDNDAFRDCANLKTVVFPDKVERLTLGCDTFSSCTALQSSNPKWKEYERKERLKLELIDDPYVK